MILSSRQRRRIARLCLLVWCLLIAGQFAHGAHSASMLLPEAASETQQQATHSHNLKKPPAHSATELAPQHGAEHHCHYPHSSQLTGTDSHNHHHSPEHSIHHQLMECDCLLCKLVTAPALAPAWQMDVLVQRSLQADPDTLHVSQPALPRTQPPGRAPPR